MTVVVTDRVSMVADSQITDDGLVSTGYRKVMKTPGGMLVGGAGDYTSVLKFFRWVIDGMDMDNPPHLLGDFCALVLLPDGRLFYMTSDLFPMELNEPYACIGSGGNYASGMMAAGKTPYEAVKLTCARHQDCSEPIYGVFLDKKEGSEDPFQD